MECIASSKLSQKRKIPRSNKRTNRVFSPITGPPSPRLISHKECLNANNHNFKVKVEEDKLAGLKEEIVYSTQKLNRTIFRGGASKLKRRNFSGKSRHSPQQSPAIEVIDIEAFITTPDDQAEREIDILEIETMIGYASSRVDNAHSPDGTSHVVASPYLQPNGPSSEINIIDQAEKIPGHILVHDGDIPVYECLVCEEQFTTEVPISSHDRCANEEPYECNECEMVFTTKQYFDSHVCLPLAEQELLTCIHCDQVFESSADLTVHEKSHWTVSCQSLHHCPACSQYFASLQELSDHVVIDHLERLLECFICTQTFSSETTLKWHIVNDHMKPEIYHLEDGEDDDGVDVKIVAEIPSFSLDSYLSPEYILHLLREASEVCERKSATPAIQDSRNPKVDFKDSVNIMSEGDDAISVSGSSMYPKEVKSNLSSPQMVPVAAKGVPIEEDPTEMVHMASKILQDANRILQVASKLPEPMNSETVAVETNPDGSECHQESHSTAKGISPYTEAELKTSANIIPPTRRKRGRPRKTNAEINQTVVENPKEQVCASGSFASDAFRTAVPNRVLRSYVRSKDMGKKITAAEKQTNPKKVNSVQESLIHKSSLKTDHAEQAAVQGVKLAGGKPVLWSPPELGMTCPKKQCLPGNNEILSEIPLKNASERAHRRKQNHSQKTYGGENEIRNSIVFRPSKEKRRAANPSLLLPAEEIENCIDIQNQPDPEVSSRSEIAEALLSLAFSNNPTYAYYQKTEEPSVTAHQNPGPNVGECPVVSQQKSPPGSVSESTNVSKSPTLCEDKSANSGPSLLENLIHRLRHCLSESRESEDDNQILRRSRKLNREEKRNFECYFCHTTFTSKRILKTHQLIHMNQVSGNHRRVGMHKSNPKHQLRIPKPPREKKYKCAICSSKFRLNIQLKQHVLTHSWLKRVPGIQNKGNAFPCETCFRIFPRNCDLQRHQRVHM